MSQNQAKPDFDTESRGAVRDWQTGAISFDDARRRIQALISQAQKENNPINQGNAHLIMSYLFSLRGRHEHALGWAKNAERLFKQVNNLSLLAGVYISQGEIYRSLKDYLQASKLYEQAYEAAVQADDSVNKIFARGNEGHVALAQNRLESARDFLEEALKMIAPFFNDEAWLASPKAVHCEYQSALAETYFRLKDYEAAWKNAAQCYEIAQSLEQGIELGKVNQTIGGLIAGAPMPTEYARFGQDFRPYFEAALAIFKSIGADFDHAQACAHFGDCLVLAHDTVAARGQYQYAISLYSSLGMYPQARQVTQKVNSLNTEE
jgi:tetratricopeptide (TPR) repeat protein